MSDIPNPTLDPIGYRCKGCGRLCRDPHADLSEIRERGAISCCPERKMVGLSCPTDAQILAHPKVRALVEAAQKLHHAVCDDTGFAFCVRADSGKAYPWPALDTADELVRAALAALPEVKE
jgi:hypothetical protein